ncbi:hypothetical protein B9Z55_007594 [Caenorhabditis nigoni]|uniref:Uncharacterized protein n=1 Tax=Caenorhabditis nigoni TaxID=1611254 RepID=A0A2G5VAE9_9PELO|nr:hypothetical protein B9Z55_007594 [Caenorhabditis nigoni]
MGRFSYCFYNGYLCFVFILIAMTFTYQICDFFSDEIAEIWTTVIFSAPAIIWSIYDCLPKEQQRQTASGFIWNRYFLAGLVLAVNFALPANNVIGLLGKKYFIILTIIIGLCHLLFVISICEHFACHHQYFRLSFPKDSKITNLQLFGLILFHILLVLAFLWIFRICPEYISNTQRYKHNTCLRVACHLINIMSIPLNYCALLAWNSKKLNFKGIHPVTKRRWVGVMKKDKKGEWVVDVEPEDHRIFVV